MTHQNPYRSFWMGGFEGADHLNGFSTPLDMAHASGHVERLDEDYAAAARCGLHTVRESIGWRLAEPAPGRYDFDRVRRVLAAGRHHGVQVVWTLMHYGTPPDVDLFDDAMIERFVAFAGACADVIGPLSDAPPIYNLINEIGFLAWAISETEMIHPYHLSRVRGNDASRANGYDAKKRLVRAVLAGIERIRRIDARARFLHTEPVMHVVAPDGRPDLQPLADQVRSYQWQAWDLISGRSAPELGGSSAALDMVGVNYYHCGQSEVFTNRRLDWATRDPRRMPFSALLTETWERYHRPVVVAETSHVGSGRAAWLHEIGSEVAQARARGVPVEGVCLYPLIDRNDWSNPVHWHRSGLWDASSDSEPTPPDAPQRRLHVEYAQAIAAWQRDLPQPLGQLRADSATVIVFASRPWDGARHRLQQLMLRLAAHYRVVVVEPPLASVGPARLDRQPRAPGLDVLVPRLGPPSDGFTDRRLGPLLADCLQERGCDRVVAWLEAPAARALAAQLRPLAVIVDHDDALRDDPTRAELTETADLFVAWNPAPEHATPGLQRRVHHIAPGVDLAAFDPQQLHEDAAQGHAAVIAQHGIAGPRLGYFGVVDDRFDLPLLAALADSRPDWQFVIVGPLQGVCAAALPRRANIHWLGLQPYHALGYFAAGWQVLLLPLRTDAPQHSPTRALEYLATGKPVVCTAVPEIVRLHGSHVAVANGVDAFAHACAQALAEAPVLRSRRVGELRPLLADASWDASAAALGESIKGLLARGAQVRQ